MKINLCSVSDQKAIRNTTFSEKQQYILWFYSQELENIIILAKWSSVGWNKNIIYYNNSKELVSFLTSGTQLQIPLSVTTFRYLNFCEDLCTNVICFTETFALQKHKHWHSNSLPFMCMCKVSRDNFCEIYQHFYSSIIYQ